MTTRETVPKRVGGALFTEAHARQLLGIHETAADFLSPPYGQKPQDDDSMRELMAKHWERYREKLLPDWIQEKPGTRPYSWWLFDCPLELRRFLVDGKEWEPARRQYMGRDQWVRSTSYGTHRFIGGPGVPDSPSMFTPPEDYGAEDYEPERDYLARHGLLTDEE